MWTIKPTQPGTQALVVHITVPIKIDGADKDLTHQIKNISAYVEVKKSFSDWVTQLLPAIAGTLILTIAGMIGFIAKRNLAKRDEEIKKLEGTIAKTADERKAINEKLARLKAFPSWQFWRK